MDTKDIACALLEAIDMLENDSDLSTQKAVNSACGNNRIDHRMTIPLHLLLSKSTDETIEWAREVLG